MSNIPPAGEPGERRLAAILAADIAGYSRLMGEDEEATVRDLKSHQAVVLPLVGKFGGKIIDTAGDGILAQFPSAVRAVECAVEIQTIMAARNFEVPEGRRMRFRIGVNVGDIIHDDVRAYGDGINIAARLESIANPGGIYISENAREAVFGKLGLPLIDRGVKSLKNISRPVRAYQVQLDGAGQSLPKRSWFAFIRRHAAVVVGVLALPAGGLVWWKSQSPSSVASNETPSATSKNNVKRLHVRFEEQHDRLKPCCLPGIIRTFDATLTLIDDEIIELRRISYNGQFSSSSQAELTIGKATGRVMWTALGADKYKRFYDDLQSTSEMIVSILPSPKSMLSPPNCTLDVKFALKPGFTDAVFARADNGEVAHFTLPKVLNTSCDVL